MSLSRKDLDGLFCKKLKFELVNGTRHDHYQLILSGNRLPLPSLMTVSRCRELANRNIDGLADNLGLNRRALESACQCHLGRACILLCLVAELLTRAAELADKARRDPLAWQDSSKRLQDTASMILVELPETNEWTHRRNAH